MRSGAVISSRPEFYDRSPITQVMSYAVGGVVPHGPTIRATYTVPVNRKAWFDSVFLRTERSGPATGGGIVRVELNYAPSGGGSVVLLQILHRDGAVATNRTASLPALGFAASGDVITLTTQDTFIDGVNDYTLSAKFTEYDA